MNSSTSAEGVVSSTFSGMGTLLQDSLPFVYLFLGVLAGLFFIKTFGHLIVSGIKKFGK